MGKGGGFGYEQINGKGSSLQTVNSKLSICHGELLQSTIFGFKETKLSMVNNSSLKKVFHFK